mmetsp:Transcript_18597/g.31707  ORF Transcript_18597/g.31707 Transcript_18597/m.31707 type:complete len:148 (+) Transcript_18597:101-544(+)
MKHKDTLTKHAHMHSCFNDCVTKGREGVAHWIPESNIVWCRVQAGRPPACRRKNLPVREQKTDQRNTETGKDSLEEDQESKAVKTRNAYTGMRRKNMNICLEASQHVCLSTCDKLGSNVRAAATSTPTFVGGTSTAIDADVCFKFQK